MKYNVLILSVGRRVELVKCFKTAAQNLKIESEIIGGDCADDAPALYFCDKSVMLPRISEPNYIDAIIEVCNKESISLVVPTIDTDLLLLSKNKAYIEKNNKTKILISNENIIEICRNKVNTQRFLEKYRFNVPHLYTEDEIENENVIFPVFIKPQDGSSSVNTFKANDINELYVFKNIIKNPIIQDYMQGEEYTVDVFLDFNSNIITVVPRLRITVRSGEILKGKIIKDREIIADVINLMQILKPIGHITVQCMKTKDGIQYIEINPRFGGGAPMSIYSGADSCKNLYKLLIGEELVYNEDYEENLLFLRFDSSICLDEYRNVINNHG